MLLRSSLTACTSSSVCNFPRPDICPCHHPRQSLCRLPNVPYHLTCWSEWLEPTDKRLPSENVSETAPPVSILSHIAAQWPCHPPCPHHPARQRHAAFTPACFALPSGTAPRKCIFHQGRVNPHGTTTSRTYFRHTFCLHTRSYPIIRYRQSSRSPATRRVYANIFRAPQWHGATQTYFPPRPRKSTWHCNITDIIRHTVCPHTRSNHITWEVNVWEVNASESNSATSLPALHLYYKLATSESNFERLFPELHLYYKLATSKSSFERLFPKLYLYYKVATSESSSESSFPHYICTTNWPGLRKLFPVPHLY